VSLHRWNQLDLAIVLLSIMGITLEEIEVNASLPINPTIIRIMRVLRIARGLYSLPSSYLPYNHGLFFLHSSAAPPVSLSRSDPVVCVSLSVVSQTAQQKP